MKWCASVYVLVFVYCVNECDGLKILIKLKDLLHPTVPTTTVVPTLPQYEKQPYFDQDDSKSWERESIASNTKTQNSKEDVSSSQSSEKDGERLTVHTEKWNLKPDKTPTLKGNNYGSTYGGNKGNQFSSHDKFDNKEFQTTTKIYDQSNNGDYPGQYPSPDSLNNQDFLTTTKTYDQSNSGKYPGKNSFQDSFNHGLQTTTKIYDQSNNGNYPGQYPSPDRLNNQEFLTTTKIYDQSNSGNYPDQSSFPDSFNKQTMKPKTPTSSHYNNQNHPQKSVEGIGNQITENNSPTTYENTIYNEAHPGVSPDNTNIGLGYASISTTSVAPDRHSVSSLQEGNQNNYTSGQPPLSSTTKGSNQKKFNNDGAAIVFPDNPALEPTPETEGTYSNRNPNSMFDNELHQEVTPAPVNEEEGRRIIDGPLKECNPGQVYDKNKNVCKELARK